METFEECFHQQKTLPGDLLLALEVTSYAIRIVVTTQNMKLLEYYEARTGEIDHVLEFIEEQFRRRPGLRIVGSPLDCWPPLLERALRERGIVVRWLSPVLMRKIYHCIDHWNRKRRLHRARLLTFLFSRIRTQFPDYYEIETLVREWERIVAHEILEEAQ